MKSPWRNNADGTIKYSVVVPVFNNRDTLPELTSRIDRVLGGITDSFEIIFIDDHSPDDSWPVILELQRDNPRIWSIRLFKNLGRHGAIVCAFHFCRGAYVITLDADLQHRPEDIPRLLEKVQEGYEVIFADFKIKRHASHKNLASRIKRWIEIRAYDIPRTLHVSGFQLLDRGIVQKIIATRELNPYLPGLIFRFTPAHKLANVVAIHEKRQAGHSAYGNWKSLKFFANMLFNATSSKFYVYLLVITTITLSFLIACILLARGADFGQSGASDLYLVLASSAAGGVMLTAIALLLGRFISTRQRHALVLQDVIAEKCP